MSPLKSPLTVVAVVAILGAAAFAPIVAAPHFDRTALREAKAFCESVAIGDSEAVLQAKTIKQSVKLDAWPLTAGAVRYQAWFSGFLANASTCEIVATNGVVTSKFVEQHKW
jgi:hypothetical protein